MIDVSEMSTASYLAMGSKAAFETGCLNALRAVEQTEENKAVFADGFVEAITRAVTEYMADPANKESTRRVFSAGESPSQEEVAAHATSFAQFFIQKGKDYVGALIAARKLTLIAGSPEAPTQAPSEA